MAQDAVRELAEGLRTQIGKVVVGHKGAVNLMLVALLTEGHVLLEGLPGTAKTLLARLFASALSLEFGRIQFTPDLMPGDVIGTNLFNFQTNEFTLTKGPVFTEILLADEINRSPPKTQSALLEAMQERAVTLDGTTHQLSSAFLVVATQNPIEQEGTYPLPEAQLDRFLLKIPIRYPNEEQEREMVRRHGNRVGSIRLDDHAIERVADLGALEAAREECANVTLSDEVLEYLVAVVRATRDDASFSCGASPRATNMLAAASRALAALGGRDYVVPDDVKKLAAPVLGHRVVLSPTAEIEGRTGEGLLKALVDEVPAPR